MKVNKNWLIYFILFFFTIQPKIFTQYKFTVILYIIANLVIFFALIIKTKKNDYKISKLLYIWVAFRLYIAVIMIINVSFNDFDKWGVISLMVINLIFIIERAIANNETNEMLSAATWLSIVYLSINLITLFYFPNGIIPSKDLYSNGDGDYYFLGIKIKYTVYIISTMTFAFINLFQYKRKKTFIIAIILSIATIFIANISTAIVCLIFFIPLYYLVNKKNYKMNVKWILIITIIVNYLVVVYNIQNLFSGFIENVLNKSVTLTGRADIWKKAIAFLEQEDIFKLVFGNGIRNDGDFVYFGGAYWPAHNQWLQNIYEMGFFGTALFCLFLIKCDKKVKNKTSIMLICMCATIMLGTITNQFFENAPIYIPFILLNYADNFKGEKNEK